MHIAHLILCHANPPQLERLIIKLAHKDASFYIHLDGKTDIQPFLYLAQMPGVYFINNRVKVYWGGYSIVQATVNGMEEITTSGRPVDYINLLSGQDYPIKSTAHIHNFFQTHPGKAYMHSLVIATQWQEAIPRYTKRHLTNLHFPGRHVAEQFINIVMPKRRLPDNIVAVGRSQWFTISAACASYIVNYLHKEKRFKRFFSYTWAPDEFIFQTILYNSAHKKDMVNNNFRYVDWSAGGASPKTLTMDDARQLKESDAFFARKFNPGMDSDILDYLDELTK